MRRLDTLFARLFGVFLVAIVLGHFLAFAWLDYMGYGPPAHDRPPPAMHSHPAGEPTDKSRAFPPPPFNAQPDAPHPDKQINRLRWILGSPFLFQLAALIIAAWVSARLLTQPISRLTVAAQSLSDNLDSPPIAETGPRETREAARVMNYMRERIVAQIQQRGRMLTAMSHDLRTPLARLKLRIEEIEDPQVRNRATQDVNDMIALLNATLDYLREQRSEEPWVLYDIHALAESLVENAQDDGANVRLAGYCRPIRVQAMALRSCLTNLLDNALRYAGHATLELHQDEQHVEIRVIDQGPGIPEEYREAVFEPFYRLEGSRNRYSGGVGLGLSIVREGIERQGGTLKLLDTPGGGLTVLIRLLARD